MSVQWQLWLCHFAYMGGLLFADSKPKVLCPLDSHSKYVTVVCHGPLQSQSTLINWTVSSPGKGDDRVRQLTCDTSHEQCTRNGDEDLNATVTEFGGAFISVATFRNLDSRQGQRHVTCSMWGVVGDSLLAGDILCVNAVPGKGRIERCTGLSPAVSGFAMLCESTGSYCGVYKRTSDSSKSLNSTRGDARDAVAEEPVAFKSFCKRGTAEVKARRFERDGHGSNRNNPTELTEMHRRVKRGIEDAYCTPEFITKDEYRKNVTGCYVVTEKDKKLNCQDKKSQSLNITCRINGSNHTRDSTEFNLNPEIYEKLFCICYGDQMTECNTSKTIVHLLLRNQTCKSSHSDNDSSFSLFYIFAGVLSVYCFIFVSATCGFIWKHGAELYSYYYMDLYRKVKRELTQNKPALPPPRLPPRRSTARSINAQEPRSGIVTNVSAPDVRADEEETFTTHSLLQNSVSGRTRLLPVRQNSESETLDDGYLVPRSLTLPNQTTDAKVPNLQNSAPRRFNSINETRPKITGNSLPPPLPCKRQDGNQVRSNFHCAINDSSDSISSTSSSLDSEDSLSIHSVDDYT